MNNDARSIPKLSADELRRFFECVPETPSSGCLEWSGTVDRKGYGTFRITRQSKQRNLFAARVAYALEYGNPGGLCVLHGCDNPPCMRPDHLFLGTVSDNHRDMERKGRMPIGESHANSVLSVGSVHRIRQLVHTGITQRELGQRFGVSRQTIGDILCCRTWRSVENRT